MPTNSGDATAIYSEGGEVGAFCEIKIYGE